MAVDQGAAGIREPQELGALVESLSHRIVEGFAQHFHVEIAPNQHDLGMAAAYGHGQKGEWGRLLIGPLDEMSQDMRFHVVYLD